MSKEEKYTDAQLTAIGLERALIPQHVAVIMDGNGRWAQKRGLPRIEGHRRGVTSVRCIVEEASRLGMKQLTLFCFSSENWKRPPRELTLLMHLLKQYVIEERREIHRQGLRFKVIGNLQQLDPMIQTEIQKTIDFYRATAVEGDGAVQRILLSGGGSKLTGLREFLTERFDMPVEWLDPFRSIKVDARKFDPDYMREVIPEMAIAVGLALRGVDAK